MSVAIALMTSGAICLFLAGYQYMELQFEVNRRLPEGQKYEPLLWTLETHQQFRRLYKQVLPGSERPKYALLFGLAGLVLFFSGIGLLLVVSNS